MASIVINPDSAMRILKDQMNAELMAAAEPAIQEAVKQVEQEVRKRFGALVVSLIEQQFSVCRNGTDLHIVVHQQKGA